MTSRFHAGSYYFFMDSDHLSTVETRMYGFAVTDRGIVEQGNGEFPCSEEFDGCGTYVLVERSGNSISIKQDFCGDFGIFVYRDGDYFALSNSFFTLLDGICARRSLTLNEDYIDQFLSTWIVALGYSETPILEIERIPSHATVLIDVPTRSLSFQYVDYAYNSIPLSSAAGIGVLDRWYRKWIKVVRGLCASDADIRVDLSGGFDSRLVFSFMLNSGVDLGRLWIRSLKDGVHTHTEDYEIASEMANHYGFVLNDSNAVRGDLVAYSRDDIAEITFHVKMMFETELSFAPARFVKRRYSLGGYGGETVRPYWDGDPGELMAKQSRHAYSYRWELAKRVRESTERVIKRSYVAIGEKYGISDPDSSLLAFNLFRECYSRNHFGRINVEGFINNALKVSPLLDPQLHKLKLSDDACPDKNLLYAAIFTRYCPDLLEFAFDGGRSFKEETLAYARAVNAEYPLADSFPGYDDSEYSVPVPIDRSDGGAGIKEEMVDRKTMDSLFLELFKSEGFAEAFRSRFDSEFYARALEFAEKGAYFPLRHVAAAIGAVEVSQAVTGRDAADSRSRLERLGHLPLSAAPSTSTAGGRHGVTARVDISISEPAGNAMRILDVSDGNARVSFPDWFNRGQLGAVIQSDAGKLCITVSIQVPDTLAIALRSPDVRNSDGAKVENWISYTRFSVNEAIVLDTETAIWHDKPFKYEQDVRPGDVVNICVEWHEAVAP